ncbi:MAG: putative Ig domain-containing protein, partial [Candidatus Nanoarchaeia archaeon]
MRRSTAFLMMLAIVLSSVVLVSGGAEATTIYNIPSGVDEHGGYIYVADLDGHRLVKQDAATLDVIKTVNKYSTFLTMRPCDVAVVNGYVYTIDWLQNSIVKFDLDLVYVSSANYAFPGDYDYQAKSICGGEVGSVYRIFIALSYIYNYTIESYTESLTLADSSGVIEVSDGTPAYTFKIEYSESYGSVFVAGNYAFIDEYGGMSYSTNLYKYSGSTLNEQYDMGWSLNDNATYSGLCVEDDHLYAICNTPANAFIVRHSVGVSNFTIDSQIDLSEFIGTVPGIDLDLDGSGVTYVIYGSSLARLGWWTPHFITMPVTTATVAAAYSYDSGVNCTATYSLDEAPVFLHINPTSGHVYGVPDQSGAFTVSIKADADGRIVMQTYTLTVAAGTAPAVYSSSHTPSADGYILEAATAYTDVEMGRVRGYPSGTEYRTYMSIDTSGVPSGVTITKATLYFRTYQFFGTYYLYSADYGESLTAADWGSGSSIIQSASLHNSYSWLSVDVPVSSVNVSGPTQFEMRATSAYPYGSYVYLSNSSYAPYMLVSYEYEGVTVTYLDAGGASLWSTTALADIEEYNNTVDAYTISVDTWANGALNMTIPTDWSFTGATPYYANTVSGGSYLLLNGTLGNMSYRVQFFAPRMSMATAWVSYYDATTGTGLDPKSYIVKVSPGDSFDNASAQTLGQDFVYLIHDWTYTIALFDYFGNMVSDRTFSTSSMEVFVNVAVDVNSFKIANMKGDFTKVRIYYTNSTAPIEFYLAPYEVVDTALRDGNYTVTVTFYNNHTATSTVYFHQTVSSAEFMMINADDTISEVISDIAGVYALQEIITYMLTPDVVNLAEDLPMVPNDAFDSGIELVHPWSVVHGWANGTEFTNETLFYYTYYTARKYYEVTLNVTNNDGVNWTNVTWFIGFPENRTIDYSSVRVYDLNNAVYLQAGLHYDMTLTGIRMKWTYFNDTLSRSLRISMYDANASSGGGMAIAVASEYSPSTYDGEPYYKSTVSWTNSFTYAYQGQYQVQ